MLSQRFAQHWPSRPTLSVQPIAACLLALAAVLLSGCSGYAIEGRVVRGPAAAVQLVDSDDPRLSDSNRTGGYAEVVGVLEPQTPTERRDLGRHVADQQGRFAIPVDAFGSGFLEYEAQVIARRDGNVSAMGIVPLPRRGQRVLITLPLGEGEVQGSERFIDEVIRDAEPYLQGDR